MTLYESFHKKSKLSKKIISKDNYTYKLILKYLDPFLKKGISVLDVGCGVGSLSLYAASKDCDVVGIDISPKAIEVCKRNSLIAELTKRTNFYVSNFPEDEIGFKKKFDMIICSEAIEHIENDRKAIMKLFSILEEDGMLFLSTPSINSPLFRLGLTKNFDKKVGHLRRYDLSRLVQIVKCAGFEMMESHKTEGILRNFLFLNSFAGKFIRFIRGPLVDLFTFIDDLLVPLFGEADLIIIARKKK